MMGQIYTKLVYDMLQMESGSDAEDFATALIDLLNDIDQPTKNSLGLPSPIPDDLVMQMATAMLTMASDADHILHPPMI